MSSRRALILEDEEEIKDTKKTLLEFKAELAKKEEGLRVMADEVLAKEAAVMLRVGGHPLTSLDFKCNTRGRTLCVLSPVVLQRCFELTTLLCSGY
jgi:hypothetical protein